MNWRMILSCRPVFALPGRRNVQHLAILGDRAPGHREAALLKLVDELLIGKRFGLILLFDDLFQLALDLFPGDLLAGGRLRATAEEAFERKDAAWRLHPLIVHGP